jgi:hypothetical protein
VINSLTFWAAEEDWSSSMGTGDVEIGDLDDWVLQHS